MARKAVHGKKSSTSTSIVATKQSFNYNDIIKAEREQQRRKAFISNKLNERTKRVEIGNNGPEGITSRGTLRLDQKYTAR